MLKVLFMGTPKFAARSLEALLDAGHQVVGVVTQPDKPVGRGGRVQGSAVKELAVAKALPLFQPKRIRRPEVIAQLKALAADLSVVVAFGQILSREALEISPLGSLNVHGSLLPRWRGAAPVQRAIMAGDTETGICTMWMDEGMDTGPVCLMVRTPILPTDTGGSLFERLSALGAELLVETLRQIEAGTAPRIAQPSEGVTHAAKIERADEVIDWNRSAVDLVNQIRALNPGPFAVTEGPKGMLKIIAASLVTGPVGWAGSTVPGTVVALVKREGFVVATGRGYLLVRTVQPPGKGRMDADSFVNGGGVMLATRLGCTNGDSNESDSKESDSKER